KRIYSQNFANSVDHLQLRSNHNGLRAAMLGMTMTRDPDILESLRQDVTEREKDTTGSLDRLEKRNQDDPYLWAQVQQLASLCESYDAIMDQGLAQIASGEMQEAIEMANGILADRHNEIRTIADRLGDEALDRASAE